MSLAQFRLPSKLAAGINGFIRWITRVRKTHGSRTCPVAKLAIRDRWGCANEFMVATSWIAKTSVRKPKRPCSSCSSVSTLVSFIRVRNGNFLFSRRKRVLPQIEKDKRKQYVLYRL